MALKLSLLGPFAAWHGERQLTSFRNRKTQALLIYLTVGAALDGRRREHQREQLTTLLWPGLPQQSAQVNLRQTLYQLRQMVPQVDASNSSEPVPLVVSDRQRVWLHPEAIIDLDVATFLKEVDGNSQVETLSEAAALYRDDFLADFYLPDSETFEMWTAGRRAELRRLALDALARLTSHYLAVFDYEEAEQYARRQLEIDNLRESGHRQLMEVLARRGQRSAALAHYETCRRILAQELGTEPDPATVNLYEQIRQNQLEKLVLTEGDILARLSPGELSASAHYHQPILHNLPTQTTPFIGREPELAALGQHLADPTIHLITILGPGGMGKTRLALAVAEAQLNSQQQPALFPQGVCFVSLARLETAGSLAPAIAEAVNFRFYEGDEPKAQLLRYLRHKAMLLILDNFEHLRAGADLVDEIVQTAPAIKLLVTSREKLNRQAEQLFPIGGMALPPPQASGEEDNMALTSYGAIHLFCQYARRVRPDFALTAENQSHVLSICYLVQGMPLGIVLAATWLELLTTQEVVAEMSRSLDFLATDMGDVPERQRSLRAAFDHSWRLLSQREQGIFRQLSIFRGGFTREAAEAVTGASLRDLQALVNKSLLNRTTGGRYEVHELLRQFAAEKLVQAPDIEAAIRDRHSATYCAFLHEHTEQWHTDRQLETLATVTQEADNVQVAWRWALAQGEWQRLVQAIDSWGWFHLWQGRYADGESFCQAIVKKAERQSGETAVSPDCLRLWARALAWLGLFTDDLNIAVGVLQQSLALLERPELAGQDTRREKASVLLSEGMISLDQDLQEAQQLIEQSLAFYRELGNQWGIALGLLGLSQVDWRTGNYDAGLDRVQAALAIHQERGDWQAQAESMTMLGLIHKTLGHLEEAERLERAALTLSQRIGDRSQLVVRHGNLAYTLLWQGKFAEAQQLAGESLAICRDLGDRLFEGWVQYCLSEALMHSGQYEQAGRQAASGLLVVQATGDRRDEGSLYGVLGQLALAESSYARAQAAFAKSGEIFRETQYSLIDFSLAGLGYTACRLGQPQAARQHLAEALSSVLAIKSYKRVVFALPGVALLLAKTGAVARAVEIWALARRHPFVANSRWFEDVAGRELDDLVAILPAEVAEAAQARGRALDLWETAAALLADLQA